MTTYVRGNTIIWTIVTRNEEGNIFSPDTVKITVDFPLETGGRDEVVLDAVEDSGAWTAEWESADAKHGTVYWSMRSEGLGRTLAQDGTFLLSANRANPDPS